MSKWVKTNDRLPKPYERVEIYVPGQPLYDYKAERISRHIAALIKGKPFEANTSGPWKFGDEFGNNMVPYAWQGDGPMTWHGQDVTFWKPLEPGPLD